MTSTREAMRLLRSANPVPQPGRERADQARVAPVRAPRRPARRFLIAAAAVAALAVAAGVVPLPWTHGAATPAAAAALDQAAQAADISARDEAADAAQYWRIRTIGTYLAVGSSAEDPQASAWLGRSTRVAYISVDGSRPSWVVDGPTAVTQVLYGDLATDGTVDGGATWTTGLAPNDTPGSWQRPNSTWLASLPRDPDALRDRIYDDTSGHGRSHDGEVLVYIADVLRSGIVPAELRAALFRVLETVPGVDVVRRHEDGLLSIGRLETVDGERQEIIIDPANGAYVGDRIVQVKALEDSGGTIPAGTVRSESRVTQTVVDDVPSRVRADAHHWTCTVQADGGVACQN